MIYFDRIEVVNMLVPSAGTNVPSFSYSEDALTSLPVWQHNNNSVFSVDSQSWTS